MKRSILDFDQARMVELGLSAEHLLVLDWYRYWRSLDTMSTVERDGRTYAWVSHAKLREDMPILGQKSDSGIRKLLQKLVDVGVLERIQVAFKNGRGSRAYYTTGVQFVALVNDQRPKLDGENQRPASEMGRSDSPVTSDSPARKNTPTEDDAQATPSPHKQVVKAYHELHKRKTGEPPTINGKQGKIVQRLVKAHDISMILAKLERYYSIDEWYTKGGRDIALFETHYDRIEVPHAVATADTRRVCSECGKKDPHSTSGSCMFCGGAFAG